MSATREIPGLRSDGRSVAMPRYFIAEEDSMRDLEKEVLRLIELGYVPAGGPQVHHYETRDGREWLFAQALWLPKAPSSGFGTAGLIG